MSTIGIRVTPEQLQQISAQLDAGPVGPERGHVAGELAQGSLDGGRAGASYESAEHGIAASFGRT